MRVIRATSLALLTVMTAGGQAGAQSAPAPVPWLDQDTMTGDWGGLRTDLADDGVRITGHYVAEAAGNPVGGREQGGAYADEFSFGADISSNGLGWDGGTLHALITERAGSSLSKDKIGNLLTVQEIYGDGQTVRLTQLSYEQSAAGGLVDAEAGYINTENNFAASSKYFGGKDQIYCEFQNNAICGTPIAAPINTSGYVAYPASSLGARVQLSPSPNFQIGAGAYEDNPTLYQATNGFKLGTSGGSGVLTVAEARWSPQIGGQLGTYRLGAYYDNSAIRTAVGQATRFIPANSPVLGLVPFESRSGQYGGWLLADQQVSGGKDQGTVLFCAFQFADPATALIPWYGEAGILHRGVLGRKLDSVSLGFAIANLNQDVISFEKSHAVSATAQEYMLEVNYGWAVANWMTLHPGIQYVWHPDGEAERRNAVVLALKTNVTF